MNLEEADKKSKFEYCINITITSLVILLSAIPVLEVIIRILFQTGITASHALMRHIVLWIAFLGSYIATLNGKHLAIEAGRKYIPERFQRATTSFCKIIEISLLLAFFITSIYFIFIAFGANERIGYLSTRFLVAIMPVCFLGMAINEIIKIFKKAPSSSKKAGYLIALILVGLFFCIPSFANNVYNLPGFVNSLTDGSIALVQATKAIVIFLLVLAGVLGAPIFIVLGGIAYILFSAWGGYTEIIMNEMYVAITGNMIPAIPLFTITGFILSESKAGKRLVNFFKESFGWFPGGIIIAAVLISAFFTTFTGASGVTILAVGGLMYIILQNYGVDQKFRTGILTSSGSIGLLFPPSLPIILYAITANLDIRQLFIAGILPGILIVLSVSTLGIVYTRKHKIPCEKINFLKLIKGVKECFWELLLPFIIIISYFSGWATITETAAIAVTYILIVEVFIHRDLDFKGLIAVVKKSVPVIGGILIILGMSKALSFYMVDEMIPQRFSEWVSARITSKIVFLILLNIALLIIGCFMDIFSAILVIVPLLIPLAEVYGIDPVHLAIIFLANLELGYITPPVGLNIFLASYRFEQPLEKIYLSIVPFFFIMLLAVIIITFVPQLSLMFIR
ncbi:MAG: TRAP transporter large permease subunit [Spirochaetes bacterium]|nr:TRAP transporter large permease subunit [Spirochaetota bacterium]